MKIRTPPELGAAIRDRRRMLKLGQGELAKRVGVSRQWIIEIEKGKPGAATGLVLRTLEELGMVLTVPEMHITGSSTASPMNLNSIIKAARKLK